MVRKQKIDFESHSYYKPEPFPLDVEHLSIEAKTKSGLAVRIASQKDATLRRFDKVKNPNLILLADFENGKIYMKKDDGSLWLLAHNEDGLVWIKLKNYVMEILEALAFNYRRNFQNPIPKQIWITQNVKAKMLEQIAIIQKDNLKWSNSSRNPREKHGLFSNSISVEEGSEKVVFNG
jgi:hypothetical protein